MSHFACIVIGDDIEKQLQPYHEFECTGTDDEYVQEIDDTENTRKYYSSGARTYIMTPSGEMFPDGSKKSQEFWRDMTDEENELFCKEKLKFKSKKNFMVRSHPDMSKKTYQIWELPDDTMMTCVDCHI